MKKQRKKKKRKKSWWEKVKEIDGRKVLFPDGLRKNFDK